jgi:hypothetical protein
MLQNHEGAAACKGIVLPPSQCSTFGVLEPAPNLIKNVRQQWGSIHVNLASRLDVLAMYAVFAFVGAVLLGAF